jgi:hypothetical protein
MSTTADSKYAFLTQFDTVFLIDDSGSMVGRSWRETKEALSVITPILSICITRLPSRVPTIFP